MQLVDKGVSTIFLEIASNYKGASEAFPRLEHLKKVREECEGVLDSVAPGKRLKV